ncbi:MAG: DUF5677 domain-containing protein [Candidatus Poribacteria bacterium]|nr:DUF5677 domain-containing protein [Candidatus Poribacteria bacterium]
MDEKVSELLDLTKKLLDLSKDIFGESLTPHESLERMNALYSVFLRVQMQEALRFGYGAYYSCYHGWGHGGIGAARSIYEILLDIKYINHDQACKDERFERFMDHRAEVRYRVMERALQIGRNVPQEKQRRIKNDYDLLKKKYKDKHDQDLKSGLAKADATPRYRSNNWAGIDTGEKVKEVNLEQFHQLYKNLSDLSHVSMRAVLEATRKDSENQIGASFNFHPNEKHCFSVLNVVFPCIYGILGEYMTYFGIKSSCYPTLEKILEDRGSLKNKPKG